MKVELVLSKTYVCMGKVYNSGRAYEVSTKVGRHLLAQANERHIPYFRKAADGAQAHIAPAKSINKGGIPVPVEDEDSKPDPAEDVVVAEVDDDDDAPAMTEDGDVEDDDADAEEEEAITV